VLDSHLKNRAPNSHFSSYWKKLLSKNNDGIEHSRVAKILNKTTELKDETREKLINYISSARLSQKDILSIICVLLDKMSSQPTKEDYHDDKQYNELIEKISGFLANQTNIAQHGYEDDLIELSIRLISRANDLETQLDRLNRELEDYLDDYFVGPPSADSTV
jgi:hypothetical protein